MILLGRVIVAMVWVVILAAYIIALPVALIARLLDRRH